MISHVHLQAYVDAVAGLDTAIATVKELTACCHPRAIRYYAEDRARIRWLLQEVTERAAELTRTIEAVPSEGIQQPEQV